MLWGDTLLKTGCKLQYAVFRSVNWDCYITKMNNLCTVWVCVFYFKPEFKMYKWFFRKGQSDYEDLNPNAKKNRKLEKCFNAKDKVRVDVNMSWIRCRKMEKRIVEPNVIWQELKCINYQRKDAFELISAALERI